MSVPAVRQWQMPLAAAGVGFKAKALLPCSWLEEVTHELQVQKFKLGLLSRWPIEDLRLSRR